MVALPSAPAMAQGDRYWQVRIAGQVMHCTSWDGARAVVEYSHRLNDVGHASRLANGQPLIQINPGVMAWFSPIVAQWWFAHECAHHALPPGQDSEAAADCYATRQMVASGVIRDQRPLNTIARELSYLPGNPLTGHLPGPARAQHISACGAGMLSQLSYASGDGTASRRSAWRVSR